MSVPIPGEHARISYTGDGTAYSRTFSDIPYSGEIALICDVEAKTAEIDPENLLLHRELGPYFEARFKSLSSRLKASGAQNIIELASGKGPRGLLFAQDPSINYIETDLPAMMIEKRAVLKTLCMQQQIPLPQNLRLEDLNALDAPAFERVVGLLPPGPLAIGHEGLLAYLDFEEKAKVAETIRGILLKRGGVWITPDLNTLRDIDAMSTPRWKRVMDRILERTGRDYRANAFSDSIAAERFYRDLGFDCVAHPLGMVAGPIVSTEGVDPERVRAQLNVLVWEFRVRK